HRLSGCGLGARFEQGEALIGSAGVGELLGARQRNRGRVAGTARGGDQVIFQRELFAATDRRQPQQRLLVIALGLLQDGLESGNGEVALLLSRRQRHERGERLRLAGRGGLKPFHCFEQLLGGGRVGGVF